MNKEQKYITYADLLKILTRLKSYSEDNLAQAINDITAEYTTALRTQEEKINTNLAAEEAARIKADEDLDQTLRQDINTEMINKFSDLSQRFVSKFVCPINSFGDIANYQERKAGQYYIANIDFRVEDDSSAPLYRQIKQGDRIVILKDGISLNYSNYLDAWKIVSQDENGEYLLDREVPIEVYNIEQETDLADYISTLSYDVDPTSSELSNIDDTGTQTLIDNNVQNIPDNQLTVGEDGVLLTDEDLNDIYFQSK